MCLGHTYIIIKCTDYSCQELLTSSRQIHTNIYEYVWKKKIYLRYFWHNHAINLINFRSGFYVWWFCKKHNKKHINSQSGILSAIFLKGYLSCQGYDGTDPNVPNEQLQVSSMTLTWKGKGRFYFAQSEVAFWCSKKCSDWWKSNLHRYRVIKRDCDE